MNLSAEHLDGLAVEIGFGPETLEKVIRLGELAADIGRHPGEMIRANDEVFRGYRTHGRLGERKRIQKENSMHLIFRFRNRIWIDVAVERLRLVY